MQKIAIILLVCLLTVNLAAGAGLDDAPCPRHLCWSGPMGMSDHNGMINFALPMQGCGQDCDDIFCDLMKDPLQNVNAVNSSPSTGPYHPVILGTVDILGPFGFRAFGSESRYLLPNAWSSYQIPLYLEHLALII